MRLYSILMEYLFNYLFIFFNAKKWLEMQTNVKLEVNKLEEMMMLIPMRRYMKVDMEVAIKIIMMKMIFLMIQNIAETMMMLLMMRKLNLKFKMKIKLILK